MRRRYDQFNQKRRIKAFADGDARLLADLAAKVVYGGNPEHKMHPGDFGLTPPSGPRLGKSLCDGAGVLSHRTALQLLKLGLEKGLVSNRFVGPWPKNIWSVTESGMPMEAQLENSDKGMYHGYPMPENDPLASDVLSKWGGENVRSGD